MGGRGNVFEGPGSKKPKLGYTIDLKAIGFQRNHAGEGAQ